MMQRDLAVATDSDRKLDGAILVTGAGGVLGTALLEELRDEAPVCLIHESDLPGAAECVLGDITRLRLGLDPAAYRELARRTRAIVHLAAVTNFDADASAIERVNVGGTINVLAFAAD